MLRSGTAIAVFATLAADDLVLLDQVWQQHGVVALAKMEGAVEELEQSVELSGQKYDAVGHGGSGDASSQVLRLIVAKDELERERARVNAEVNTARSVLYGVEGDGGLAKAKDSVSADVLCAYYLQGMSWPEVAESLSSVIGKSANPKQWCLMRSRRALEFIDVVGIKKLPYIILRR